MYCSFIVSTSSGSTTEPQVRICTLPLPVRMIGTAQRCYSVTEGGNGGSRRERE